MCNYWKKEKENSLDIDTYKNIVKDLIKINPFVQISLYGGEPLMRKDIYDFLEIAKVHNLKTTICTNGFLLNEKNVKKLADAGLYHLYVSLDGFNQETHDKIRGVKGSYDKIINALKIIHKLKNKFFVSPTFVIMKDNFNEVIDFVKWGEKRSEIKEVHLQLLGQPYNTQLEDYWYRNPKYSHLWPTDIIKIKKTFKELIKLKQNKLKKLKQTITLLKKYEAYYLYPEIHLYKEARCNVKDDLLNIYDDGNVFFCFKMPPIGNVYKDSIYKLWYSRKAEKTRNKMIQCKTNCMQVLTNPCSDE